MSELTAEQVRDAVMSADRWEKPMGNTGLTNTHLIIRDDGWQVIADELNAALGDGECEITNNGPWGYPYVCSACDASFDTDVNNGDFNYCPNCGAKVRGDAR